MSVLTFHFVWDKVFYWPLSFQGIRLSLSPIPVQEWRNYKCSNTHTHTYYLSQRYMGSGVLNADSCACMTSASLPQPSAQPLNLDFWLKAFLHTPQVKALGTCIHCPLLWLLLPHTLTCVFPFLRSERVGRIAQIVLHWPKEGWLPIWQLRKRLYNYWRLCISCNFLYSQNTPMIRQREGSWPALPFQFSTCCCLDAYIPKFYWLCCRR